MKLYLALLVSVLVAACDVTPEPVSRTESPLSAVACTGATPAHAVDVYQARGCRRYQVPAGDIWTSYYINPGGSAVVTSVSTGTGAAAWVCDSLAPIGVTQSPYAPCWRGGTQDSYQRVRGAPVGASYAAASAAISSIVGQSVVVSLGHLVGPPACPYTPGGGSLTPPPVSWTTCGYQSDSGLTATSASTDPGGSTCCQVSGLWPDGSSGAPCLGYDQAGNYTEIVYGC